MNSFRSQVAISKEIYEHDKEIDTHIEDRLCHEIAKKMADEGQLRITNLTERALQKYYDGERISDYERELVSDFERTGMLKFEAETVAASPDRFPQVARDYYNNIELTHQQAEQIWKLLPVRITGMKESDHPLNPSWFGTIQRKGDKELHHKLKNILKQ